MDSLTRAELLPPCLESPWSYFPQSRGCRAAPTPNAQPSPRETHLPAFLLSLYLNPVFPEGPPFSGAGPCTGVLHGQWRPSSAAVSLHPSQALCQQHWGRSVFSGVRPLSKALKTDSSHLHVSVASVSRAGQEDECLGQAPRQARGQQGGSHLHASSPHPAAAHGATSPSCSSPAWTGAKGTVQVWLMSPGGPESLSLRAGMRCLGA